MSTNLKSKVCKSTHKNNFDEDESKISPGVVEKRDSKGFGSRGVG